MGYIFNSRHMLESLGNEKGLLGLIFNKSQNKFQDPSKLRRLVVDLIDKQNWSVMSADVKGDAYEGLLEKNAQDTKSGAGQYFTPRPLIQAMVDVVQPKPKETLCDPACGTGGFLLAAHDYVVRHNPNMSADEKRKLKGSTFKGWELVQSTARLCAMNLMLHSIGTDKDLPIIVSDSLAADPGDRFDIVLTNPPFGKKSSTTIVAENGKVSRETDIIEREDFWATTSNKQLNFIQHVKTLLKQNGRAAVVVPDNVLFEGGAGETIRRKLPHECETPWTKKLWIYDLRTNMHFTLKTSSLQRTDLDEFMKCYNPENRHSRKATWKPELDSGSGAGMTEKGKKKRNSPSPQSSPARGEEGKNEGRWRSYNYDELVSRDKASLDIFWLKDESLEASDNLPDPYVIAQEIVEDLEAALEQFREITTDLGKNK